MLTLCVPGCLTMAIFCPGVSQKWPRTGKGPLRGNISPPCIQNELALEDMRAMHPKSPANRRRRTHRAKILREGALFAAQTPRIMHGAQILPSVVAPNRPSVRDPGAAEQCEPPELDRPTQETQPRRQRPRRLLGSKYRQQLPRHRQRSLPTLASSFVAPANNSVIADSAPVETNIHAATAPPIRRAALAQGGLPSLLVASVFCALGRCDRFVNARQSPFYAIISLWLRKNRHPSGKNAGTTYTMGRVLQGHVPIGLLIRKRGYDGSCCILR